MLQITPQQQLYIAIEPVDFRKGIDGLKRQAKLLWQQEPFSGFLFIFRNRNGTSIKLLTYDGNGFWLCQKRFSKGKLKWWPRTQVQATQLCAVELMVMLQQGLPKEANVPEAWRQLH